MIRSRGGCVGEVRNGPAICSRNIDPAGTQRQGEWLRVLVNSAPNDHLSASPYCSMMASWGRDHSNIRPTIAAGIVSTACVEIGEKSTSAAPDDHFAVRPYRGVRMPGAWRTVDSGSYPTVTARVVFPAGVKIAAKAIGATPNDHHSTGPDCSVRKPRIRRVANTCSCPTVCARIVGSPCVQRIGKIVTATPDNHRSTGPDCSMRSPWIRRVRCAR